MDARKISVLSAIAASSCCIAPLILLGLTLLGIGTAGFAGVSTTLGSLKWYFLPLAVIGLGTSYWLYFREKKKCAGSDCKVANKKLTLTMLTVSTVVVCGFLFWSVYPFVLGAEPAPSPGYYSSARLAVFEVEGMTCGSCELAVDGAIAATGIADSVRSSFVDRKAYVWYSRDDFDEDGIREAIASVGYTAVMIENH